MENYAADRAAAAQIAAAVPEVVRRARENRAFVGRAVRLITRAGIRQFLDVGAGLPTQENVHQVAHAIDTRVRVAYVDNDPVVLAHARAILEIDSRVIAIDGDMREPAKILRSATKDGFLDLEQPIAILMAAVLHFIPSTEDAARIVAAFREHMAHGSFLVITHATAGNMTAGNLSHAVRTYAESSAGSITPRNHSEVQAFFDGLDLLEPGLVPVACWRLKDRTSKTIAGPTFLGGVARKL